MMKVEVDCDSPVNLPRVGNDNEDDNYKKEEETDAIKEEQLPFRRGRPKERQKSYTEMIEFVDYSEDSESSTDTSSSDSSSDEEEVKEEGEEEEDVEDIESYLKQESEEYDNIKHEPIDDEYDVVKEKKATGKPKGSRNKLKLEGFTCAFCLEINDTTLIEKSVEYVIEHMRDVHGYEDGLVCVVCREEFSDKSEFSEHLNTHDLESSESNLSKKGPFSWTEEKTWICEICLEESSGLNAYIRHQKNGHDSELGFNCPFCERDNFKKKEHFVTHLETHSECAPKINCEYCGKVFTSGTKIWRHIKEVHEGQKRKGRKPTKTKWAEDHNWQCHICKSNFKGLTGYIEHQKEEHNSDDGYVCPLCSKSDFNRKEHFIIHLETHTEAVPSVPCQYCGKMFANGGKMQRHLREVHEGKKEHLCNDCGKTFSRSDKLKTHKLTHLPSELRPHICGKCGRGFSRQEHVQRHENKCEEIQAKKSRRPPSNIEVGSAAFASDPELVKIEKELNILGIAKDAVSGMYTCPIEDCGSQFKERRYISEHYARMHRGRGEAGGLFPYQCAICERGFKLYKDLKRHESRPHKDSYWNKKLVCPQEGCNMRFRRNIDLRAHHMIHTNERPFKCVHCDAAFTQRQSLKSHFKGVHKLILPTEPRPPPKNKKKTKKKNPEIQQGYHERQVKQEDQPLNLAHGDMWTPHHSLTSGYFSQPPMSFNPALSQWILGADNRLTNLEGRAGVDERSPEPKSRPMVMGNERTSMGHELDWGYNRSQDTMTSNLVCNTERQEFPGDSMDGESLSTAPDQDHQLPITPSPVPSASPALSNIPRETQIESPERQLFQPQSQILTKIHPKKEKDKEESNQKIQHYTQDGDKNMFSGIKYDSAELNICPENLILGPESTSRYNKILDQLQKNIVVGTNMEVIKVSRKGTLNMSDEERKDLLEQMSSNKLGAVCPVCGKIFKNKEGLDIHFSTTQMPGHGLGLLSSLRKNMLEESQESVSNVEEENQKNENPMEMLLKEENDNGDLSIKIEPSSDNEQNSVGKEPQEKKKRSKKKPFQCFECQKNFKTDIKLLKHVGKRHGKGPKRSAIKVSTIDCDVTVDVSDEDNDEDNDEYFPTKKEAQRKKSKVSSMKQRQYEFPNYKLPQFSVKCDDCPAWFASEEMKLKHMEGGSHFPIDTKSDGDIYPCLEASCGMTFSSTGRLLHHMKIGKHLKPCPTCGKEYDQLGKLYDHIDSHTSMSNKKVQCKICQKYFADKTRLKVHTRTHTGERPYLCVECGTGFTKREHLKRHTQNVHLKLKPVPCDECDMTFADKYKLNMHKRKHTGETPFLCTICAKGFKRKETLDNHMMMHTTDPDSKEFVCVQCGAKFVCQAYLNRHIANHFAERKFACDQCPKAFIAKKDLVHHVTHVHTDAKPYQCNVCKNFYKSRQSLDVHKKTYPNGECTTIRKLVDPKTKKHGCDLCERRFNKKSLLQWHYRMHTGDRPYPCTVEGCNKAFTQNQLLRAHLKQYHKLQLAPLPKGGAKPGGSASSKSKSKAKRMKTQEEGGPLDPVLLKEVFDRNGSMVVVTQQPQLAASSRPQLNFVQSSRPQISLMQPAKSDISLAQPLRPEINLTQQPRPDLFPPDFGAQNYQRPDINHQRSAMPFQRPNEDVERPAELDKLVGSMPGLENSQHFNNINNYMHIYKNYAS